MPDSSFIAIILAIIAAVPGIWGLWQGRHKLSAETANKWMELAQKTADELSEEQERRREMSDRLVELESKVSELERENKMLRDGINRLIGQLMTLGVDPVWKPNEKLKGDI